MSQLTITGAEPPLAVNVTSTLNDLLDKVINFGARAAVFLLVLGVGWLVARVLRSVTTRLLRRTRLDRTAEGAGVSRWTGRRGPSGLAGQVVYYGLALVTLQLAFGVFGPNPVSDLLDSVLRWLPRALVAAVILAVAVAGGRLAFHRVDGAVDHKYHGRALARTAQGLVIAVGAIAALAQVGVGLAVTVPLLVALLATMAGVIIVGVGGGLIRPMRERWDRALTWIDIERGRWEFERTRSADTHHADRETDADQDRDDAAADRDAYRDRDSHLGEGAVAPGWGAGPTWTPELATSPVDGAPAPAPAPAPEDAFGTPADPFGQPGFADRSDAAERDRTPAPAETETDRP